MTLFRKIKHSILLKIFITTIFSVIAINYILLYYMSFNFRVNQQFFIKNSLNSIRYLLEDLGNNPTQQQFEKIKNAFGFEIEKISEFEKLPVQFGKIETDEFRRGPGPGMMERHHIIRFLENPDIILQNTQLVVYNKGNRIFVNMKYKDSIYKISYMDKPPFLRRNIFSFAMIMSISLVILIMFVYIKSLLKPLKDLNNGIEKISSGNLNHEVPVHADDELGSLSESFNNMNSKIRDMIKSKEQLLFDVSHELRTPLTRIKLALALMKSSTFSESITEDVDELEIMINEILETARGEQFEDKLEITECKISDILKTSIKLIKLKKHQYILNISSDYTFSADRKKMVTVIKNLLENSVKYSDSNKYPIEIRAEISKGVKTCSISDKGVGIPEKDIGYVFEPFYRVDKARTRKKNGFGLGLHLCKKIIDIHNFRITIESIENEGTTVTVYF